DAGVGLPPTDRRSRPAGPLPRGPGHVSPPVAVVPKVDRSGGLPKDERAGDEKLRVGARVIGRVERPLGDRRVAGLAHEAAALAGPAELLVHPEAIDCDASNGPLLGVEVVRAHGELAARNPPHRFGGRRSGRTGALGSRRHAAHTSGAFSLSVGVHRSIGTPCVGIRTSTSGAMSAAARANSCAGLGSGRGARQTEYVPQWIGTATLGQRSVSASAARLGSRWPGGSRGPQPATGSSARSSGASSRMPPKRSVSPAK